MAKISELTGTGTFYNSDDLLVMVYNATGISPKTRKMTLTNFRSQLMGLYWGDVGFSGTGTILTIGSNGNVTSIAVGSTDQVLTPNSTGVLSWNAQSGGGGGGGASTLTNVSGGQVVEGDVVINANGTDASFKTSTQPQDRRVIGVATQTIANGNSGSIGHMGKYKMLVSTSVFSRGDWFIVSSTAKEAKPSGAVRPDTGFVGMALETTSVASSVIDALIFTDMAAIGYSNDGEGYLLTGYNAGATSKVQELVYASETWSTKGNKMPRSTYYQVCGSYNNAVIYQAGGYNNLTQLSKYTVATDTGADTAATLNGGRFGTVGGQDHAKLFFGGGSGTWDRRDAFTFATETRTWADFSLSPSVNEYSGCSGGVYDAGNTLTYSGGYRNSSSYSTTIYKINLGSSTTTTVSALSASKMMPSHFTDDDGNEQDGYFAGGNNGSNMTGVDKFPFSTESISASTAMSSARNVNGGLSSLLKGYHCNNADTDRFTFASASWSALGSANPDAVYASSGHSTF